LQPNVTDQWLWRHDPSNGYIVRSAAYNLLTFREVQDAEAATNLIWHKQIPLKTSMLALRLLRNKLPIKDNLVRRHMITYDSHFCVTDCGGVQTAQHIFLSCPVLAPLWSLIRTWVGISLAGPFFIQDNFVQFTHSAGGSRVRRSFL
jgi:hypothetical protein